MYGDGSLEFVDQSQVNKVTATKYLGDNLNAKIDIDRELNIRINERNRTWNKLDLFWKNSRQDR